MLTLKRCECYPFIFKEMPFLFTCSKCKWCLSLICILYLSNLQKHCRHLINYQTILPFDSIIIIRFLDFHTRLFSVSDSKCYNSFNPFDVSFDSFLCDIELLMITTACKITDATRNMRRNVYVRVKNVNVGPNWRKARSFLFVLTFYICFESVYVLEIFVTRC